MSNIHVKISKYGVPLRPVQIYCQCSMQTIFLPGRERQDLPEVMRCENPQRTVVTIKRTNQINLRVCSGAPAHEARQRSTMGKKIW